MVICSVQSVGRKPFVLLEFVEKLPPAYQFI